MSAPLLPGRERDVIIVLFEIMLEVAMAGFGKQQAASAVGFVLPSVVSEGTISSEAVCCGSKNLLYNSRMSS